MSENNVLNIDTIINKLCENYPKGGIYSRFDYYNGSVPKLSIEEIQFLLEQSKDIANFKNIISHNKEACQVINNYVKQFEDDLIYSWFYALKSTFSRKKRKVKAQEKKEKRKIAEKICKEREKVWQAKQKEKETKKKELEDKKARNKATLWKALNLTSEQKKILSKVLAK